MKCCPNNMLAVLEDGNVVPNPMTQAGSPPGITDWKDLATQAANAVGRESDLNKKAILNSALGVATASGWIPVAGWITALGSLIIGGLLSFLGIRGTTQHVNQTIAEQKASDYANQIRAMFDRLPQDAQAKLMELALNFFDNRADAIGSWWGGALGWNAHINRAQYAAMTTSQQRQFIGGLIGHAYAVILHQVDADGVEDAMKALFFDPMTAIVLQPLDRYMLQKYNATVDQYNAAGGTQLSPKKTLATAGIVAVGIGLLFALPKMLKGVRR